jgi:DNA modification methylase
MVRNYWLYWKSHPIISLATFGMGIEPIYVDVAVKRWEDFTHKKAKLLKGK